MATIKEDYVSFEIAKLLKEKGFDEGCRSRYGSAGSFSYEKYEIEASECEMHNAILAPTIQMARKWLREVHNIDIEIHTVRHLHNKWYSWFVTSDKHVGTNNKREEKYEQACEAAIKYCLEKLI